MTIKIELNLKNKDKLVLENVSEICRTFYNDIILYSKSYYNKFHKFVDFYDIDKQLPECKEVFPQLNIPYSKTIQKILYQLRSSYLSFFKKRKNGDTKAKPPKYKCFGDFFTLTYNQSGFKFNKSNTIISFGSNSNLNKLYLNYKYSINKNIFNNIEIVKQISIIKENNKYYLIVNYKPINTLNYCDNNKTLYCDPGVKTLLTGFDGENFIKVSSKPFINRNKYFDKQIDKLNSKIDKAKKNSNRKKRLVKTRTKLYFKKKAQINHSAHAISKELAKLYSKFVIGNWTTHSNKSNIKQINRVVNNQLPLSKFISFLEYKSKGIIKVDERYTTKTCCICGNIKNFISVNDRVYICENCQSEIERDANSSVNIFNNENRKIAGVTQPLAALNTAGCSLISFMFYKNNKAIRKSICIPINVNYMEYKEEASHFNEE